MKRLSLGFGPLDHIHLILIALISSIGCRKNLDKLKPTELKYIQPFKDSSIFYNKIPSNVPIDPNSDKMVEYLVREAQDGIIIAVKKWTVPVYYADPETCRYDVKLTASWAPAKKLLNVPIPDYAEPDPSDDGHMVIIDTFSQCVYDLWIARKRFGKWKASWANAIPLNSDGIYDHGFSARGSGFSLLQGVIWPHELQQGYIPHALIFSFDYTKAGGPVPPATESDGDTDDPYAIPEGALIQLDPSLNLDSLGLTGYEKVIAKALQEYGMYCADDGIGLQLYAINPISVNSNNYPYNGIWNNETYIYLKKVPVEKFRVIKLPAQYQPTPRLTENECAKFDF